MLSTRASVISPMADNCRLSPAADMSEPQEKPRDARYHNDPRRR